ncbi:MAG TPA: T9SS type A sorting domain-containing protein, partial [Bacteroidales bacterium]|nr:T9SS type A sorting domain-containing protein [Bacteroidales bacterium]
RRRGDKETGRQGDGETRRQGDKVTGRGLEMWPNPCQEILNFKFSILNSGRGLYLSVYDVFGREIRKIDVPDTDHEIKFTVEDFVPGLYLVVLKDDNTIVGSAKMVVSR